MNGVRERSPCDCCKVHKHLLQAVVEKLEAEGMERKEMVSLRVKVRYNNLPSSS